MTALETRCLDPERDAMGLIELFEWVFGATVSPGMWYWKYVPPWAERYYCWVARDGEQVIGYVGAVPLRGIVDGEQVPFFQLADAMVHPDYRLKYDYFDLGTKHLLEDLVASHPRHLLYGFSEHRAFLWFKRLGLSDLIEKATTRYVRTANAPAQAAFAFRDWKWDDAAIEACWQRERDEVSVGLVRDGMYLRWRYGDHPVHGYRLIGIYRADAPIGWAVIGSDRPGEHGRPKETPVVDMLMPEDCVQPALADLSAHLEHDLMTWLPNRLAPGFAETKVTKTNVFHFTRNSVADTAQLQAGLYYTMGDVDWW